MNTQKYKRLVFGIIGYGSIGKIHAKILKDLGHKIYIYDPEIKKKNIVSFRELNKSCNVIIICSPSYTHLKYLKFYSEKKKHIFIEKPFSHEITKTRKILKLFKKENRIVGVNYNLRSRKCILLLKKIINKTKKIYWANFIMSSNVMNWRKNYKFSKNYTHHKNAGGIVFDSIHEIDLNFFLFKKVKYLNSHNINLNKKIFKKNSFSLINLLIKDKFLSSIQLDYHGSPDQRKIKILTDLGLIDVDIKKNSIRILNEKNKNLFFKKFNVNKFVDYKEMLKNFIECINNKNKNIICSSEEAIENVKIATQVNE